MNPKRLKEPINPNTKSSIDPLEVGNKEIKREKGKKEKTKSLRLI